MIENSRGLREIERLIDDLTAPQNMTLREAHDFLESVVSSIEAKIDGLRDNIINR